jgi:hypothetical protein
VDNKKHNHNHHHYHHRLYEKLDYKKEFLAKKQLIYHLAQRRHWLLVVEQRNYNENNNHSHWLDWMVHMYTENSIDDRDIENKTMFLD